MDNVREVLLTPNSNWGGSGTLGCGLGYGYLHRIPMYRETNKPILPKIEASNQVCSTLQLKTLLF